MFVEAIRLEYHESLLVNGSHEVHKPAISCHYYALRGALLAFADDPDL